MTKLGFKIINYEKLLKGIPHLFTSLQAVIIDNLPRTLFEFFTRNIPVVVAVLTYPSSEEQAVYVHLSSALSAVEYVSAETAVSSPVQQGELAFARPTRACSRLVAEEATRFLDPAGWNQIFGHLE